MPIRDATKKKKKKKASTRDGQKKRTSTEGTRILLGGQDRVHSRCAYGRKHFSVCTRAPPLKRRQGSQRTTLCVAAALPAQLPPLAAQPLKTRALAQSLARGNRHLQRLASVESGVTRALVVVGEALLRHGGRLTPQTLRYL